jgi:transcriptional regulator with XRE-family HTH domain
VEFGVIASLEKNQVNGDKLRQLREARGWDVWHLARLSCLSVSQVQALESGGMACFYSQQIKHNAARKLANVLGVPESTVFMQVEVPAAAQQEAFEHPGIPDRAVVNSKSLYAKPHAST